MRFVVFGKTLIKVVGEVTTVVGSIQLSRVVGALSAALIGIGHLHQRLNVLVSNVEVCHLPATVDMVIPLLVIVLAHPKR